MAKELSRAARELRDAFGRAQTEDDVRYVLDIASDVRREMGDSGPSVEQRLAAEELARRQDLDFGTEVVSLEIEELQS